MWRSRSRRSAEVFIWTGWALFVASFLLPAVQEGSTPAPGYWCAWLAMTSWGPRRLGALVATPGDAEAWAGFLFGWFNLTNLAAVLAPAVVLFRWARPYSALVALICAYGGVQALALVSGGMSDQPLWGKVRVGFAVWWMGYLLIALGAWSLCPPRRP